MRRFVLNNNRPSNTAYETLFKGIEGNVKKLTRTLTMVAVAIATATHTQAAFIGFTEERISPSNPTQETAAVEALFPGEDLEFLVKWNDDGSSIDELGSNFSAADAALVTLTNRDEDILDITWDLASIGAEVWGVVVKAGRNSNIYTVEELDRMSFDAASSIVGPDNKDISHFSLIGKTGLPTGGSSVPDAQGTMALLALGLGGIAGVSRRSRPEPAVANAENA